HGVREPSDPPPDRQGGPPLGEVTRDGHGRLPPSSRARVPVILRMMPHTRPPVKHTIAPYGFSRFRAGPPDLRSRAGDRPDSASGPTAPAGLRGQGGHHATQAQ